VYVNETDEEIERLNGLCDDPDPKIALLAMYIVKIINACDREEEYKCEMGERG